MTMDEVDLALQEMKKMCVYSCHLSGPDALLTTTATRPTQVPRPCPPFVFGRLDALSDG